MDGNAPTNQPTLLTENRNLALQPDCILEQVKLTIDELQAENEQLKGEVLNLKNRLRTTLRELTQRNEQLAEEHQQLSDSINYALRIQTAILPPDYFWRETLPNSFIFYRPKDVVSGDFYFVGKLGKKVVFAAVDCTGHGVPGALMSVLGFNNLDQAVRVHKMAKPSDILSFLDEGVNETLRQTGNESGVYDGMDLAVCTVDLESREVQYAGAYNPMYIVSNGSKPKGVWSYRERPITDNEGLMRYSEGAGHVLTEVKADKLPIGVNEDGVVDIYTNHTIFLNEGDTIYLFSDGYADQFGGPKGKKFKYVKLKELLLNFQHLSMPEIEQLLISALDEWQGDHEQIDDILVMGVRL